MAAAAAAAASAGSNKEKSWTLGHANRKKSNSTREKNQMPMRPRSVNSTFEKTNGSGRSGSVQGPGPGNFFITLQILSWNNIYLCFNERVRERFSDVTLEIAQILNKRWWYLCFRGLPCKLSFKKISAYRIF